VTSKRVKTPFSAKKEIYEVATYNLIRESRGIQAE